GLSILAANAAGGSSTCNGTVADCSTDTDPTAGLAIDTAINTAAGTYTFANWKDVLRVLFAGMDHDAGSDIGNRDCNSAVRQALAADYGKLFQTACTTGNCGAIRHVFRRDDLSDTTDAFGTVLGLPGISYKTNASGLISGSFQTPYCNAIRAADAMPPDTYR